MAFKLIAWDVTARMNHHHFGCNWLITPPQTQKKDVLSPSSGSLKTGGSSVEDINLGNERMNFSHWAALIFIKKIGQFEENLGSPQDEVNLASWQCSTVDVELTIWRCGLHDMTTWTWSLSKGNLAKWTLTVL